MEYIALANIGQNVIYTTHNKFGVTRYITLNESTVTNNDHVLNK